MAPRIRFRVWPFGYTRRLANLPSRAAEAEARTSEFLERYYGGGVNFRGLMGLGPVAAVFDVLKRYEQAGVTDLCIRFAGEDQVAQLEQFIEGVLPAL